MVPGKFQCITKVTLSEIYNFQMQSWHKKMLHMTLHWINLANLSETFTFYLHVVATNLANAKLLLCSFITSSSITN